MRKYKAASSLRKTRQNGKPYPDTMPAATTDRPHELQMPQSHHGSEKSDLAAMRSVVHERSAGVSVGVAVPARSRAEAADADVPFRGLGLHAAPGHRPRGMRRRDAGQRHDVGQRHASGYPILERGYLALLGPATTAAAFFPLPGDTLGALGLPHIGDVLDLPGRVDAQPKRASRLEKAEHRATHAIAAAIGRT